MSSSEVTHLSLTQILWTNLLQYKCPTALASPGLLSLPALPSLSPAFAQFSPCCLPIFVGKFHPWPHPTSTFKKARLAWSPRHSPRSVVQGGRLSVYFVYLKFLLCLRTAAEQKLSPRPSCNSNSVGINSRDCGTRKAFSFCPCNSRQWGMTELVAYPGKSTMLRPGFTYIGFANY